MAIDTSSLTGYAKTYAEERNKGASDTAAHAAATAATGTAGSGSGNTFASFEGSADGSPLGYKLDNSSQGYSLTGLVPQYKGYVKPLTPTATTPVTTLAQQLEVPTYKPYEYQEFQYESPNYSITSDASKTSFMPTSKAKDRWLQGQESNAANVYKDYLAQLSGYQQNYTQQRDLVADALAQAELEQQKNQSAAAALTSAAEQKRLDDAAALDKWYKEQLVANETAKTNYDISKPYSTGSSSGSKSSGSLTSTQINAAASNYISQNLSSYKRPIDFAAQVKRNMEAGLLDSATYDAIIEQLYNKYPDETSLYQTLSTWKG